ncbi:hypothetical protein [Methylobacterium sp. WSM2598]|uniref:hypothetical protein n=1 Tax=Methylobacterium sp. WSM2598 TaxID=398261 RepID=UPI00037AEE14|nr:hypothetical protein [Methylobacterium sp. WSM2598]
MNELLLIKAPDPSETFEKLNSKVTILQSFSPRLHEVEGSAEDVAGAAKLPGVVAGAAVQHSDLSQSEKLAVDAWHLRLKEKARPYEGMNWGSDGFDPP